LGEIDGVQRLVESKVIGTTERARVIELNLRIAAARKVADARCADRAR
jgi:hypothetical protein